MQSVRRLAFWIAFAVVFAPGWAAAADTDAAPAGDAPAAAAPAAADLSARDLVKSVLNSDVDRPFFARATLSSSRGWERELEMSQKKRGDAQASYTEVTAPHDVKDTKFLFFERAEGKDEQFMYIPALRRTIQIAEATRNQPFLGSDFYVSDMVLPELDAFTYSFVGEEEVEGRKCKLVETVPKDLEGALYGKTVLAIDPADKLVIRTAFHDKKGELIKVSTVKKLEKIDDAWTPLEVVMVNFEGKTDSTLKIVDIEYDVDLPDDRFSRSNMDR